MHIICDEFITGPSGHRAVNMRHAGSELKHFAVIVSKVERQWI